MAKAIAVKILDKDDVSNPHKLDLMRIFLDFSAFDNGQFIRVNYKEYHKSPGDTELNVKFKSYIVQGEKFEAWDITEIPDGVTIGNYIRAAINQTLLYLVPLDAENEFVIH